MAGLSSLQVEMLRREGRLISEYGRYYQSNPRYQHSFDGMFRLTLDEILAGSRAYALNEMRQRTFGKKKYKSRAR